MGKCIEDTEEDLSGGLRGLCGEVESEVSVSKNTQSPQEDN